MGRASRRKHERREHRAELGLNRLELPRPIRRQLARQFDKSRTLPQIGAQLAQYQRQSIVEAAAATGGAVPAVLIGRVIREASKCASHGRRAMSSGQFRRLANDLQHAADPSAFAHIAHGSVHDLMVTRTMTDSLPFNSRPHLSYHRSLSVLLDTGGDSLLDAESWERRLGVPLRALLLGSMFFGSQRPGVIDAAQLRRANASEDLRTLVESALTVLSAPVDELHHFARSPGDDLYELGPLARTPLIWLDSKQLALPSPAHVPLATSLPGLYIRLLQEDSANKSRERSQLVGDRFSPYLLEYARAALSADQWEVRAIDDEPPPKGKIADIAVWPVDRSFMVILEAKATLSLVQAMLGNPGKREAALQLYQESFNQVANTVRSQNSNGFLADAPTGVPVFGLTVTMDLHLTSVYDGTTYFGLVLGYKEPSTAGARCETAPCRVISADNAEELFDAMALLNSSESLGLLNHFLDQPTPLTGVGVTIDELGYRDRFRSAPLNALAASTLAGLADDFTDPALRAWFRSLFTDSTW